MNRPLALIEGDLALPMTRPLEGLPPPFGSRRRLAQADARRAPRVAAPTEAQQAILGALQRKAPPVGNSRLPAGVKHILFYKLPPQRDHFSRFDAQLVEAKRYLEMGKARPLSSRTDHVLAATIFVTCSIALAWLLATCTTHNADQAAMLAATRPAVHALSTQVANRPQGAGVPAQQVAEDAQTVAQGEYPVIGSTPKTILSRRQTPTTGRLANVDRKAAVAPMSASHIVRRSASSGTVRPATRASVSRQPEWTTHSPAESDAADRAALFNWATQQRERITTRAAVTAIGDTDWNARMIQRRITDKPDAFQSDLGQ
ncbi:MAG TPA: hypothetical protein VF534_20195 [Paraburkholderia sp.]